MSWFATLFRRRMLDERLDQEVRFHLESRIADLIAAGRSPAEARREALVEFGGVEQVKEACRDVRSGHWLETVAQDVSYSMRQLRQAPGFTATIVITLALAIGACTTIYSVVDPILIRPYLRDDGGDRLVRVFEREWPDKPELPVSIPILLAVEKAHSFEGVSAGRTGVDLHLTGTGEPIRLAGVKRGQGSWAALRWGVELGRALQAGDFTPGNEHVVFLRYEIWQTVFGGDPGVIGRTVQINGEPWTVVGVGKSDWGRSNNPNEAFVPWVFSAQERTSRNTNAGAVIARLKPGVTMAAAQAELDVIATHLRTEHPDLPAGWGFTLLSNIEWNARTLRRLLWTMFGAVACVLLIACANVANLLLARAAARQREMAVRTALGASRGRLVRQLLTESMLLALVGGAGGLLVAQWSLDLVHRYAPAPGMSRFQYIDLNPGVLAFALGLSLLTGVVFGLAPAWLSSGADVSAGMKIASRGNRESRFQSRLRSGLVVFEIAATLVLLSGAALFLRNFLQIVRDPGYAPDNVMTFEVNLRDRLYAGGPARVAFAAALVGRLQALPGVTAAAAATALPPTVTSSQDFVVQGRDESTRGVGPVVRGFSVSPDYFAALGLRLRRGRGFTAQDDARAVRVVVVSDSFARQHFPEGEPLGKMLNFAKAGAPPSWREIVGVVSDVKAGPPEETTLLQVYHPLAQEPAARLTFAVQTREPAPGLAALLKPQVYAVDPDLPVQALRSLESLMESRALAERFTLHALAIFSLVALVIAVVGIYGVIAYHVSQRTPEIGIRMALGADAGAVLQLVLGRGARLVGVGLACGLAASLAATRFVASMLVHVSARDPLTLACTTLGLGGVALLACLLPARRATRLDPMTALRAE
jgi:putative ABC transport system permease protein